MLAYERAKDGVFVSFTIYYPVSSRYTARIFIVFSYIFDDERTHDMVVFLKE
jgi:hypothetical protein